MAMLCVNLLILACVYLGYIATVYVELRHDFRLCNVGYYEYIRVLRVIVWRTLVTVFVAFGATLGIFA